MCYLSRFTNGAIEKFVSVRKSFIKRPHKPSAYVPKACKLDLGQFNSDFVACIRRIAAKREEESKEDEDEFVEEFDEFEEVDEAEEQDEFECADVWTKKGRPNTTTKKARKSKLAETGFYQKPHLFENLLGQPIRLDRIDGISIATAPASTSSSVVSPNTPLKPVTASQLKLPNGVTKFKITSSVSVSPLPSSSTSTSSASTTAPSSGMVLKVRNVPSKSLSVRSKAALLSSEQSSASFIRDDAIDIFMKKIAKDDRVYIIPSQTLAKILTPPFDASNRSRPFSKQHISDVDFIAGPLLKVNYSKIKIIKFNTIKLKFEDLLRMHCEFFVLIVIKLPK